MIGNIDFDLGGSEIDVAHDAAAMSGIVVRRGRVLAFLAMSVRGHLVFADGGP